MDRALLFLVVAGGAALTYAALVLAPEFAGVFTAPLTSRLFYFHVPIALASFLAFTVALVHSIQYLRRPDPLHDLQARAAIEIGVLFSGLTLVTGMIWGEAEWGTPWRWEDAKLVVVLIMFLTYTAYLFLRGQIQDLHARARLSAVYSIAAFVSVPLAWFAQRIWNTYHPTVFGPDAPDQGVVTPGVLPLFLFGLIVAASLFFYLYRWRRKLLALAARLEALETAEAVP